uniref:ComEA family DNA-binding protein n=1 Tax=Segeticoccus rhizosphaerae TaxID=1104777 RepID=UPI0010C0EC6C
QIPTDWVEDHPAAPFHFVTDGVEAPVAGGVAADGAAGAATDGPPLDLNAATAAQLEELPGVGPVLSQRIVEWRTEHGRFSTVDELMEVSGIGEKMLAEIAPRVRV